MSPQQTLCSSMMMFKLACSSSSWFFLRIPISLLAPLVGSLLSPGQPLGCSPQLPELPGQVIPTSLLCLIPAIMLVLSLSTDFCLFFLARHDVAVEGTTAYRPLVMGEQVGGASVLCPVNSPLERRNLWPVTLRVFLHASPAP